MKGVAGETWAGLTSSYQSTQAANDALWTRLTELTDETPMLREHRDWIESNKWGFGDRAFHSMWLLLLTDLSKAQKAPLRLLEIGVYKGQVLSLWTMIGNHLGIGTEVTGITPLAGKPPVVSVLHRLRMLVDRVYREDAHVGNLHEKSDFARDVDRVFSEFDLSTRNVRLLEGFSQDPAIHAKVRDSEFDVVYVDGGHRFDEVSADLRMYAPLVRSGGYLVVDDAGFFLPGTAFFKGFEPVSRAVEALDSRIWNNVLNVGHNRIYQRIAAD